MRKSDTVAAMFAVLAMACGGDTQTGPRPSAATPVSTSQSSADAAGHLRPIQGSCDAAIISLVSVPPTTAREVVTGSCLISHLGKTTFYLQQIIDYTTFVGTSEVLTFTAANGDVLRATSITQGTPTGPASVSLAGTFVFTGGTGRFANATGQANFTGTADFATGRSQFTMRGGIAYGKSDNADADQN